MSGRKKKHRVETNPASGHAEGVSKPPAPSKKAGAGRGKPTAASRRWPALAVQASVAGLILGVVMVSLSLISVATSNGPAPLGPAQGPNSGSNATAAPGTVATPSQGGAAVPAASSGQGVDPQRLELRTKGDPQAPVVVTEWFDFL